MLFAEPKELTTQVSSINVLPAHFGSHNSFMPEDWFGFAIESETKTFSSELLSSKRFLVPLGDLFSISLKEPNYDMYFSEIQKYPRCSYMYNNLGNAYLSSHRFNEAIEQFQQAIQLDENFLPGYANLAKAHLMLGQTREAEIIYQKILKKESDRVETLMNLAGIYTKQRKFEEAKELIGRVIFGEKDNHIARNNRGVLFLVTKDIEAAQADFEAALAIEEKYAHAQNNLGVCLKIKDDIKAAMERFRRAISLDKTYIAPRTNLARCFVIQGQIQVALKTLRDARKISQNVLEVQDLIANIYFDMGKYRRAILELEQCLELGGNQTAHLNNLGVAYHKLGDLEQAAFYLEQCLSLQPKETSIPYQNRALLFLDQDDAETAMEILHQSLSYFPSDATMWNLMGAICFRVFDYQQAIKYYQQAIDSFPKLSHPYLGLSFILVEDKHDFDEAIDLLKKAIEQEGLSDPMLSNNLAYAYLLKGNHTSAKQILDTVIKDADANPILWATLGLYHLKCGNIQKGNQLYDEAIRKTQEKWLQIELKKKKAIEMAKALFEKMPQQVLTELKKAVSLKPQTIFNRQADALLQSILIRINKTQKIKGGNIRCLKT
ncbi:tetratricopeptide repeat protein [bacterium]|nr:tetratricopeptide repeat protein [bacterium]